jgi:hypothetical protein
LKGLIKKPKNMFIIADAIEKRLLKPFEKRYRLSVV